MTGRDCAYANDAPAPRSSSRPPSVPTPDESSPSASPAAVVACTPAGSGPDSHPGAPKIPDLADVAAVLPSPEVSLDDSVNMVHLELLVNFSIEVQFPHIQGYMEYRGREMIFKAGLDAPYLMHQVMALSARHLSVVKADRSDFYMHLAVQLQTRAVSMFNETAIEVNESNCMAMLIFSSLLGRHLLIDVLARRDSDFETFLDKYTECIKLHKGIREIAASAWPYLIETELSPYLAWGRELWHTVPKGSDTDDVQSLISSSTGLDDAEKALCIDAIHQLQIGLDEATEPSSGKRGIQMIFNWVVAFRPELTDLLIQRSPEALVVLAFYALLLHHERERWQVRDAGGYLLHAVSRSLGPGWGQWLARPTEKILQNN